MMHKDRSESKSDSGYLSALVMGAAIGAAAMVLSKKENRKMVRTKVNQLLEMGEEKVGQASDALDDLKSQGRKKIAQQVNRVGEKLQETESKIRK